ncbi:uncharacterized protein LOC113659451 [Tachysurus fulvidraco]|uniref:uncharacterized protein LOC113659451 n=1 Tax=Tachysurus fulvidraco TaxID=1234273 RepID=UPI000F4F8060|nr:uncharacterized protein LOC113659451 [Tachysurus fulvidraco]
MQVKDNIFTHMTSKAKLRKSNILLYIDTRQKNHKEDIDLQSKLEQIHRKYKLDLKLLHQDRECLLREHKKLLHLRVCEPRATVTNTMRAISTTRTTKSDLQYIRLPNSAGRRMFSGKAFSNQSEQMLGTRLLKSAMSARPKTSESKQLSILYLKDLALIDSISQKELEIQEEQKRQKMESQKQLYREKLQLKMQIFFNKLETI